MAMSDEVINAVKMVKLVKAARKPLGSRVTFYSVNDLWHYHAVTDDKLCSDCEHWARLEHFRGSGLRVLFPRHKIVDDNRVNVEVHPNCRCYLARVRVEMQSDGSYLLIEKSV